MAMMELDELFALFLLTVCGVVLIFGFLVCLFLHCRGDMGNCCTKTYVEESSESGGGGGSIPNPLIIGLAGHLRHHFASRGQREMDDLPPSYDNYSPPSYEECVVVVDDKRPIIS